MDNKIIFLPVIVQIALTLWLYVYLGVAKARAVKAGEVNEARRALYDDAWPESVLKVNNCIRNQFEVPVLFYVLIGVLWSTGAINIVVHVAAWLFVLSRIVHAVVHTGSNFVPLRRRIFMFGCSVLIGITIFSTYYLLLV